MGSHTHALEDTSGFARSTQPDAVIFTQLLSIAYTGALLVVDTMNGGGGLTDADKMMIAEMMGVATPTGKQAQANAADFRRKFVDAVFGAEFSMQTGTSQASDQHLAFPLRYNGLDSQNEERQQEIARLQAGHFDRLAKAMFMKDRYVRDRIFAISMTSSKPGGDIDVLLDNQ